MQSKRECLFKKVEKQSKAAREFGFYWERIDQLIEQIQSECQEIQEAWKNKDSAHLQEEIGELSRSPKTLKLS